jgi:hypothetical protein
VVLAAAMLAMRQLKFMDRTQKLQVALRLFDEFKEIEKSRSSRHLYEDFCADGRFKLDVVGMGEGRDVTYILHTYSQIGAIVRESITEENFVVPLVAGVCVRMWIVLEEYIQRERKRREYPILYVTFEYLVILCLRFVLEHEPRQLAIYHPDEPDNPRTRKLYTTCCLYMKLRELEAEVKELKLDITESRIDLPSEMTTCPYPVCKSPFLDTHFPLPPPKQELTFPYRDFSKYGC